jgi:hypothetical protein
MTTDKTCPVFGNPAWMPPYDYFFELAYACHEKLEARKQLPHRYTTEEACLLERKMIAHAKTIFCHLHGDGIGSAELEQIKARRIMAILAHEYDDFLRVDAACYIRKQLLQVYGVHAPNETA